jgi:hypothetical protein
MPNRNIHGIGGAEVFEGPAHRGAPTGVRDVVEQRPEAAADGEREEEVEGEQPGVGEGPAVLRGEEQQIQTDDRADGGDAQAAVFTLATFEVSR